MTDDLVPELLPSLKHPMCTCPEHTETHIKQMTLLLANYFADSLCQTANLNDLCDRQMLMVAVMGAMSVVLRRAGDITDEQVDEEIDQAVHVCRVHRDGFRELERVMSGEKRN